MWGIELPQFFIDGPVDVELIERFSTRAEDLGFDGLWVEDLPPRDFPWIEPVALLTYVSALTTRVTLGTNILITPIRDPVQLAKSLSVLDQLSRGRLVLGAGMGGVGMQFEQYGVSSDRIVARFLEGLDIIKRLWSEPSVTYDGDFWHTKELSMEPKPRQRPHPPIWFGARHPDAIRRSVRYGDGWIGSATPTLADFREDVGRIERFLEEEERERSDFTIAKQFRLAVDANIERAEGRMHHQLNEIYYKWARTSNIAVREKENPIFGSAEQCAERISDFVSAGADVIILQPMFDQIEHAELLAEEVIPLV